MILLAVILLLGAGCLDPVDIEGYGYVISLGIDELDGGELYFTFMLQRESADSAGSSDGGASIIAEKGANIYDAINRLEGRIPFVLDFSRMNFMFIGEKAAKDGMIKGIMGENLESLRVRLSAVVMVCEPDASTVIGGLAANNDANITKLQSAITQDKYLTGMVSVTTLSRMLEACNEGRFDICSALGSYDETIITDMKQKKSEEDGEDPLKDAEKGQSIGGLQSGATGSALFDGWVMTGKLDRRETMLLNIAAGEFKEGELLLDTERFGTVTLQFRIISNNTEVTGIYDNGADFLIKVRLYATVRTIGTGADKDEISSWLQDEASELIEAELEKVFLKCREASCDAARLGTALSKRFTSAESWEQYDWKEKYKNSQVSFRVELTEPAK